MRKRKWLLVLSFVAAALCTVCLPGFSASAGVMTRVQIQDSFDSEALDEMLWTKYGDQANDIAQVRKESANAVFLRGSSDGTEAAVATKTKVQDLRSFQFDFKLGDTGWFGVNFQNTDSYGVPELINAATDIYQSPLIILNNYLAKNASTITVDGTAKDLIYADAGLPDLLNTWATVKFVIKSATEMDICLDAAGESADLTTVRATLTKAGASFDNCFVVIARNSSANGTLAVDNIVYTYGDGQTVTEDFEDLAGNNVNVITNSGRGAAISIFGLSALDFNNPAKDARIVAGRKISVDPVMPADAVVADFSFDLDYRSNDKGALFGVMFGLETPDAAPASAGSSLFKMHAFSAELNTFGADGANIAGTDGKNRAGFENLCADGSVTYRFRVRRDGSVTVTANGNELTRNGGYGEGSEKVTFGPIDVEGYFGFVSLNDPAGELGAIDVSVDNVKVKVSSYHIPTTKSLVNNFSNDYIGNPDNPDYYITSDPPNTIVIKDGKLNYNGASDNSFFGFTHEYDDFILDYQITDIFVGTEGMSTADKTGANKWFGLSFARGKYDVTNYMNAPMVYFLITPDAEETDLYQPGNLPEGASIEMIRRIPKSLWTPIQYDGESKRAEDVAASDAVCVRFVSEGNTLKLYFKTAGEAQFTLYAIVHNIEMTGYVALCNTGFTYLNIDNLSMAATGAVYELADNEKPEEKECDKEHVDPNNPGGGGSQYNPDVNLDEELNYLNAGGGCGGAVSVLSGALLLGALAAVKRFR